MTSSHGSGARTEARPHIFGATALHYRQGTAVANTETPPTWAPEMAHDAVYPYTLTEYKRDVSRWLAATKVNAERRGPILALAIGGAGRAVVDEIDDEQLVNGVDMDINDGQGLRLVSGPRLIFLALERKFPENAEASMLRAGLEFFGFQPKRDENVQLVFLRFDRMLDRANQLANLDISYPFRAWMLLALLRLPPKKWAEYLKDMGHRFPDNLADYRRLQEAIVRERSLENQVGQLHVGEGGTTQTAPGVHLTTEQESLPLYLCLGAPADLHHGGAAEAKTYYSGGGNNVDNVYLYDLQHIHDDDEDQDSDEEQWQAENEFDPYSAEDIRQEESRGRDKAHLAELYSSERAIRTTSSIRSSCSGQTVHAPWP